jgi:hypothetical protein
MLARSLLLAFHTPHRSPFRFATQEHEIKNQTGTGNSTYRSVTMEKASIPHCHSMKSRTLHLSPLLLRRAMSTPSRALPFSPHNQSLTSPPPQKKELIIWVQQLRNNCLSTFNVLSTLCGSFNGPLADGGFAPRLSFGDADVFLAAEPPRC